MSEKKKQEYTTGGLIKIKLQLKVGLREIK